MGRPHLHFIVTGGTFDGALKESGTVPSATVVDAYLVNAIQPAFSHSLDIPFLKDSRDITESDRDQIAQLVERSPYNKIIVIHGTYTLVETALVIHERLHTQEKTVVVTGAMVPFDEPRSDAPFNLGFACSTALLGAAGTWVAMHGKLWKPEDVFKNLDSNTFEDKIKRPV